MRISIIVDDYHGGAGNIAQLLAIELSKDNEVSLILTNRHNVRRYDLTGIKEYDHNLTIIGKNKIGKLINKISHLRKLLVETIRTEVCISFLDNNNTITCMALRFQKDIPIIVSERSNPLVIFPKFPWNILRRYAYRRADRIVVQFDAFHSFDGGRFASKCVTIPNIIEKVKEQKVDWHTSTIRFVTVARYADIKRLDLMIALFAKYKETVKDSELHIFGDGNNRNKLQDLITSSGLKDSVFLKGYLNNVHETLCEYDIYLMTSYQEGFPNSLSEAMMVGLPSVSFCCHDGLRELTCNGKCGYIVNEGDFNGFVERMIYLSENEKERKRMGLAARGHVEKYNITAVMQLWKNYILEVKNEKDCFVYR